MRRALVSTTLLVVAACGAAPAEPAREPAPWWQRGEHADCKHVPYLAGQSHRVFVPAGTRYLNDHTLVHAADGTWHLFGITHDSLGEPEHEHELLHATAPSLFGPWSEHADALTADASEDVLWVPYVIEREPGRYTMFYYADFLGSDPMRGSRRAESTDLWHWQRVAGRGPGGRDPFVLRRGSKFFLYSVGVDATSHGQILLSESDDSTLARWSAAVPALTDPTAAMPWRRGNVQSPFVVEYDGELYLFVTDKSSSPVDYARTHVFCSTDPRHFEWRPIAELHAHAAEVIHDGDRWFITSCGWTKAVGETRRGLSLAPLGWADRPHS